jgi:hypothetical protein
MAAYKNYLFPYRGNLITARLRYGQDDLVESWEYHIKGLNVAMLTSKQFEDLTGLSVDDIPYMDLAVLNHIDAMEGRRRVV